MHALGLLSALALVGSTLAAPVPEAGNVVVVTELYTVVVTATPDDNKPAPPQVTAPPPSPPKYRPRPRPTYAPPPPPPAPVQPAPAPPAPKPTTSAPPPPPPASTPAPAPAPAPAPDANDYFSIANKWRSKMGLPTFAKDATLEANAKKTCVDGNGQMKHELNPGTMGQVLAPGGPNDFEKVFVGGWLCEVPSTKGLDGVCTEFSKGWNYMGQTGHNEILTSTGYKKIGCALANGIWGCDVA